MPHSEYSLGANRLVTVSTICTVDAMIRTKTIVVKNVRCSGASTKKYTSHPNSEPSVMTAVTATPMPRLASKLEETPKKMQRPRNRVRTKLLTRTAERKRRRY